MSDFLLLDRYILERSLTYNNGGILCIFKNPDHYLTGIPITSTGWIVIIVYKYSPFGLFEICTYYIEIQV